MPRNTATEEQCPPWCVVEDHSKEFGDHHSEAITRNSFRVEMLRYYGDNITYVTFMAAMNGGDHMTVPVDTVVELMDEVYQKKIA